MLREGAIILRKLVVIRIMFINIICERILFVIYLIPQKFARRDLCKNVFDIGWG